MELCVLLVEKIVEFVRFVMFDEYKLFDEDLENIEILLFLYELNINDKSLFY